MLTGQKYGGQGQLHPDSIPTGKKSPQSVDSDLSLVITTNHQGSLVVSSLDYAAGLEIQHKNLLETIRTHKEAIEADFGTIAFETRKSEGRPTTVAYLTEDQALFVGTLSRNSKRVIEFKATLVRSFSQARQLQHPAALSPTEQLMLQLVQQNQAMLHNQQLMLDQLRKDMASLQRTQPRKPRTQPSLPPTGPPRSFPPSIRQAINTRVNEYCAQVGCPQQEAFRYLYNRMQQVYGVNVWNLARTVGETLLEAVERYGQLDRLYSLVMAELAYTD